MDREDGKRKPDDHDVVPVSGSLTPADPWMMPLSELRQRVRIIMSPEYVPPDAPLSPGWFQCYICLRRFKKSRSAEEARAEMRERFGDVPVEDQVVTCGDCTTIISSGM